MSFAPSAVRAREEPPATMIDRLFSFGALPALVFTLLTAIWVVAAIAASVSTLWVLPAVLLSGLGVLAFFGSRFAWRVVN
jgi:hypothetical protein